MKIIHRYNLLIAFIIMLVPGITYSNDLDDGIALDDPINDDLKRTVNIPFILMKAKGAELRAKKGLNSSRPVISQGENGQGNITFGIGSKIAPGTTIINSSEIRDSNSISR